MQPKQGHMQPITRKTHKKTSKSLAYMVFDKKEELAKRIILAISDDLQTDWQKMRTVIAKSENSRKVIFREIVKPFKNEIRL